MDDERLDFRLRAVRGDFVLDAEQSWPLGGCTAVFGPSGAGKSTLLRLIAGLERPDQGLIKCSGETWCDAQNRRFTPAHRRPVSLVFQDGRLFPHLTVAGNLDYAARRAKETAGTDRAAIVEAFDLETLLARRPDGLSGGERQRVALARSLLARPRLLLLDEPLSALDRRRKSDILPYLDDLPRRFGVAVVYVSHNADEILRLADRVVVLKEGRIEAAGAPQATLAAFGAGEGGDDLYAGAVLAGVIEAHDARYRLTRVRIEGGALVLPMHECKAVGASVAMRIDPRNVAIALTAPSSISIRNAIPSIVRSIETIEETPFAIVELAVGESRLRAQLTRASCDELGLRPGKSVVALVKSASFDL